MEIPLLADSCRVFFDIFAPTITAASFRFLTYARALLQNLIHSSQLGFFKDKQILDDIFSFYQVQWIGL